MSCGDVTTSYLFTEVLLHQLVLLRFAGVPENEGQHQHQRQHQGDRYFGVCVHVAMLKRKREEDKQETLHSDLIALLLCVR